MSVTNPLGLFYVSDFVSDQEASQFISKLYQATAAGKGSKMPSFGRAAEERLEWVQLRHRRLMNIGGNPTPTHSGPKPASEPSSTDTTDAMIQLPIPSWVLEVAEPKLRQLPLPWPASLCGFTSRADTSDDSSPSATVFSDDFAINHVLINEYRAPDGHILPHEDGPTYEPLVAIVSLQSTVPLVFHLKEEHRNAVDDDASSLPSTVSVLLLPNSLVVFTGKFYTHYRHEVPKAEEDVVDPVTCLNYELVASKLSLAEGEEGHSKMVSVRGNIRTSVTYRRVKNVVSRRTAK